MKIKCDDENNPPGPTQRDGYRYVTLIFDMKPEINGQKEVLYTFPMRVQDANDLLEVTKTSLNHAEIYNALNAVAISLEKVAEETRKPTKFIDLDSLAERAKESREVFESYEQRAVQEESPEEEMMSSEDGDICEDELSIREALAILDKMKATPEEEAAFNMVLRDVRERVEKHYRKKIQKIIKRLKRL